MRECCRPNPSPLPTDARTTSGTVSSPLREVMEEGGLGRDLIEGDADELDEHDLGHRPQPACGGADGEAEKAHLRDRRVADAQRPEALEQAFGRLERSLGDGDVLTEDDDGVVSLHLVGEGLGHRLAHPQLHRARRSGSHRAINRFQFRFWNAIAVA